MCPLLYTDTWKTVPCQFKSRCLHLLQRLCLIHRPVPDGMIRWIHIWAAGRTEWKKWWSHLKPHLHFTCSLFLGTQIKMQRIPYIINLEILQGYKLLKRAKHGIKAKASVERVLFSTRYSYDWAKSKDRHAFLVLKLSWDQFFHTNQRCWKSNQSFPF